MKQQRPYNLNFLTIHFPVTAIISILHRISGIIVFMLVPVLLWMLRQSLLSAGTFIDLTDFFDNPVFKIVLWVFLAALLFHLVAGIRHMIMDTGIGESLRGGRLGAWLVAGLGVIFVIAIGVWLWVVV